MRSTSTVNIVKICPLQFSSVECGFLKNCCIFDFLYYLKVPVVDNLSIQKCSACKGFDIIKSKNQTSCDVPFILINTVQKYTNGNI